MDGLLFHIEENKRNPYVCTKIWCVMGNFPKRYHVRSEITISKGSLKKQGKVSHVVSISPCNGCCEIRPSEIPDDVWDKARPLVQNSNMKSTSG